MSGVRNCRTLEWPEGTQALQEAGSAEPGLPAQPSS